MTALALPPVRLAFRPVEGHRPGDRAYRRIVAGLMLGGLANFLLLYYVQPLLPTLATSYGVSAGASAEALSVSTLAMAVALLVVGPLSDVIGRVPLMRWSLLASAVFGLASAFAPTWSALLVLRGLEGAALAGLPAVALAYLREELHPSAHLSANAAYITGTAVGGALGRLLPGPIAAVWGWQGATLVAAGITLASTVAIWLLVPASAGFLRVGLDLRQIAGSAARTVRDPVLVALCVLGGVGMGVFVGTYNAVAFRLEDAPFSLGAGSILVYLAYPVGIAAPIVFRRVIPRLGVGGTVLAGVGVLTLGVLVTSADRLPLVMIGLGLLAFAFLGMHSVTSGWVVNRAQRLGIGVAQASSTYLLVYYCGSAFFGSLATRRWDAGGWTAVLVLTLVLAVLAGTSALVARATDRRTPAEVLIA